jgi:hypothetical protein
VQDCMARQPDPGAGFVTFRTLVSGPQSMERRAEEERTTEIRLLASALPGTGCSRADGGSCSSIRAPRRPGLKNPVLVNTDPPPASSCPSSIENASAGKVQATREAGR